MSSPPTLAEVRNAFETAGLTVAEWADAEGFRRENVYAVLAGRSKGRRGESHRIARALGLKAAGSRAIVEQLVRNLQRPDAGALDGATLGKSTPEGSPMS
jgi:gp16 family phage-associated protein